MQNPSPKSQDFFEVETSPYRLRRHFRRGGFAQLWIAEDRESGHEVIAKVYGPGDRAAQVATREADIMRGLPRGIAPALLWSLVDQDNATLVMEKAHGKTIAFGRDCLSLAASISQAVQDLHSAGVVHGDLKPSHFFIEQRRVELIDFGSAHRGASTEPFDVTPGFSAPELHQGSPASEASDIYSLCATLYWLFAKQPVFQGSDRLLVEAHCNWEPPQLATLCDAPAAICQAILQGLSKSPSDRPTLRQLVDSFQDRAPRTRLMRRPAAVGEQERRVLVAFRRRGSLSELQERAKQHRGDLLSWNEKTALVSFALDSRSPVLRAEEFAKSLRAEGRPCHVEQQFFPVQLSRKGRRRVLIDGDKLLLSLTSKMSPVNEAPVKLCVAEADEEPPLVGRDELVENISRLLRTLPPGTAEIELVAAPGMGATRILRALESRLPEARFFSGTMGPGIVLVDDADELSPRTIRELHRSVQSGDCKGVVLVRKGTPTQSFVKLNEGGARLHLEPLSDRVTHALFAHFLPQLDGWTDEQRALLYQWTGGIPALIVEAAVTTKQGAFVEPRAEGKALYADFVGLELGLSTTSADRVIERYQHALGGPAYQIALELCLSELNTLEELVATRQQLASEQPRLDLKIGLASLQRAGLLRLHADRRVGLRSELLRRALYERVQPSDWRPHHRVRLAHWLRCEPGLARDQALARHASACGRIRISADAELRIAESLMRHNACAAAERAITRSLAQCAGDQRSKRHRVQAEVFLRSDRLSAALVAANKSIASATSSREQSLGHLCRAMILDWMRDFSAAAAAGNDAQALRPAQLLPSHRAELLLAAGRQAWREGQYREARRQLLRAATIGSGLCRRIALLLTPLTTLALGRAKQAGREIELAISTCEEEEDWLHLCAAIGNRSHLWSAMGETCRSAEDLELLLQLARRTGHAAPERVAAYNLAEDLLWEGGRDSEALYLARRARSLYERYEVHSTSLYRLLEARILASMDRLGEASLLLRSCQRDDDEELEALASVLNSYVGTGKATLPADLDAMGEETRLEIAYWSSKAALRQGQIGKAQLFCKKARRLEHAVPLFAQRLDLLESRVRNAS